MLHWSLLCLFNVYSHFRNCDMAFNTFPLYKPRHEKTGLLSMLKQSHRSAVQ